MICDPVTEDVTQKWIEETLSWTLISMESAQGESDSFFQNLLFFPLLSVFSLLFSYVHRMDSPFFY